MGSFQNNSRGGWLFGYGICDDISASNLIWAPRIMVDPMVFSTMLDLRFHAKKAADQRMLARQNGIGKLAPVVL